MFIVQATEIGGMNLDTVCHWRNWKKGKKSFTTLDLGEKMKKAQFDGQESE